VQAHYGILPGVRWFGWCVLAVVILRIFVASAVEAVKTLVWHRPDCRVKVCVRFLTAVSTSRRPHRSAKANFQAAKKQACAFFIGEGGVDRRKFPVRRRGTEERETFRRAWASGQERREVIVYSVERRSHSGHDRRALRPMVCRGGGPRSIIRAFANTDISCVLFVFVRLL